LLWAQSDPIKRRPLYYKFHKRFLSCCLVNKLFVYEGGGRGGQILISDGPNLAHVQSPLFLPFTQYSGQLNKTLCIGKKHYGLFDFTVGAP
jgi:hypothetical protein